MCFKAMNPSASRSETAYVVTLPRASDAVGCALRDAYARVPLPRDMAMLVARLDAIPYGRG